MGDRRSGRRRDLAGDDYLVRVRRVIIKLVMKKARDWRDSYLQEFSLVHYFIY